MPIRFHRLQLLLLAQSLLGELLLLLLSKGGLFLGLIGQGHFATGRATAPQFRLVALEALGSLFKVHGICMYEF